MKIILNALKKKDRKSGKESSKSSTSAPLISRSIRSFIIQNFIENHFFCDIHTFIPGIKYSFFAAAILDMSESDSAVQKHRSLWMILSHLFNTSSAMNSIFFAVIFLFSLVGSLFGSYCQYSVPTQMFLVVRYER